MTSLRTGALLLGTILVLFLGPTVAWAADVSITDDGIDPDPVVAEIDEIVSFTNDADRAIRLIDDDGRWDSGDLAPGDVFTITFDTAGAYGFTSEDGDITGTIEVVDPTATAEPTAESSPTQGPTAPVGPTAEPSPTAEPTAEPSPTAEPTAEASPTPAPTAPPAPIEELAATGLPSAAMAWTAALLTMAGIVVLRRAGLRR